MCVFVSIPIIFDACVFWPIFVIFSFNDGAIYFHEEEKEGLVKICRLALFKKYPKFATDGYEALYARPPVLYISAAAKPLLGQYLCTQVCK